jgi:hypothetical protein
VCRFAINKKLSLPGSALASIAGFIAPRILPRCGVPVLWMPVRIRDIRGIVEAKIESILITDHGLRITDFSSEISALFRVD